MHCSYFRLSRIFNMWRTLHYKYKNTSTTVVLVTSFTMVCDVKFLCFQTKCFFVCLFFLLSLQGLILALSSSPSSLWMPTSCPGLNRWSWGRLWCAILIWTKAWPRSCCSAARSWTSLRRWSATQCAQWISMKVRALILRFVNYFAHWLSRNLPALPSFCPRPRSSPSGRCFLLLLW